MDASAASWLSHLLWQETEDCNLSGECDLNLLDDQQELLLQQHLSSESYSSSYSQTLRNSTSDETTSQRPTKTNLSPSSPTSLLPNSNPKHNNGVSVSPPQPPNLNFASETPKGSTQHPKDQGTLVKDHIMAERKRREKLSQGLIALAALVPGLKKMDKATVLGDAANYMKELQERLRMLGQDSKNRDLESEVMVNKPQLSCDNDEVGSGRDKQTVLPHVEARVSQKDVLLRIHCQKQKGILLNILLQIQNLHLLVVNSSVLPFGNSILGITIVAQMGTGYNMTIKDLVNNIRVATLKSMS